MNSLGLEIIKLGKDWENNFWCYIFTVIFMLTSFPQLISMDWTKSLIRTQIQ